MSTVQLTTDLGVVRFELLPDAAPLTVAHVVRLVQDGYWDEASFYRAQRKEHWAPGREFQVVQGGCFPNVPADAPTVEHESPRLPQTLGAVSLARALPGTASTELFVTLDDRAPALEAGAGPPMDGHGFTPFGVVLDGLDVLRAIHARPTVADSPIELIRGQILAEPVRFTAELL
jgi:peptidyl-prolyl cis-trans isomerase A (cyclophilin A)